MVEAVFEMPNAGTLLEERGLPADGDEVVLRRELQASGKGRATVNGRARPGEPPARPGARSSPPCTASTSPRGCSIPATHLDLVDHFAGTDAAPRWASLPRAAGRRGGSRAAPRATGARPSGAGRCSSSRPAEIEKAGLASGRGGGAAGREGAPGERRAAREPEQRGLRAALRRRGGGARAPRPGVQARRGARRDRPRVPPVPRGEGRLPAPLEDLALRAARLPRAARGEPGPPRRDRGPPRARRAAQEEVRGHGRRGARVRRALPRASSRRSLSPEEQEQRGSRSAASGRPAPTSSARGRSRSGGARRRRDLVKRVQAELAQLAMEKTRFEVAFTPADAEAALDPPPGPSAGLERAEFLLSPNPGEELRPLARIASGGELSRMMLALKSVVRADARGPDPRVRRGGRGHRRPRGRGGGAQAAGPRRAAAGALRHAPAADRRLRRPPPRRAQAGRARAHRDGRRRALRDGERVEEVARMLGGETITATARQHAREMLKQSLRR